VKKQIKKNKTKDKYSKSYSICRKDTTKE